MQWKTISEAVIGADHKRKNLPLQDSLMTMVDKDFLYIAIADGHGSPLCFRSEKGSNLAVLSVMDLIQHQSRKIVLLKNKKEREMACRNVLQAVSAHWSRQAMKNLKDMPFQAEELDKLKTEHKKRLSTNALLAYGSTISFAVINRNLIFGLCLGDSDVLFKLKDKVDLLDQDSSQAGESTDSLCMNESLQSARYFEYNTNEVECFMLSTDGYRKSFETDSDFIAVIDDIYDFINENGAEELKSNMKSWLEETSLKGSGDDISCCFLYNKLKEK